MGLFFSRAGSSGCPPDFPRKKSLPTTTCLDPLGGPVHQDLKASLLSGFACANDLLLSRCHEQVHTVDSRRSWMSWRGSDAGTLPWELEGLFGGEHRDPGRQAQPPALRSPMVSLSQAGSSRNFSHLQLLCSTFYYN